MCLAVPGRIVRIDGVEAEIDFGGVTRMVNISLVETSVGDYVIVHAGFAITRLDPEEAKRTIALWNEILEDPTEIDNIV